MTDAPKRSKPPYRLVPNDPRTPIYDDRGRWVADCRDKETAELIVEFLNALAKGLRLTDTPAEKGTLDDARPARPSESR